MRTCLDAFTTTDPERETYTYAGPGRAKFWFRRAAIETELHRLDVEDALSRHRMTIPAAWVADGIGETVEVVLPLAARLAGEPSAGLSVSVPEFGLRLNVGEGPAAAEICGSGSAVFAALWGRNGDGVQVDGDTDVATEWLSRIERAFADR